jgi:hypothetical protein
VPAGGGLRGRPMTPPEILLPLHRLQSDACIAVYPDDWAVALVALDPQFDVLSSRGERTIAADALDREPGATPGSRPCWRRTISSSVFACLSQGSGPRILCLRASIRRRGGQESSPMDQIQKI